MTEETAGGAPAADPSADKRIPADGVQPRGKWANKMEFLLAATGVTIGPETFWMFPFLCCRNGGVAFLIPYFVSLLIFGIPVFFLETALGQFASEGGVTAWRKICPMFEGVGIASQVILLYQNIYYIVILAWTIFYLCNSFKYPLPWSTCENYWNTDLCKHPLSTFANPHSSVVDYSLDKSPSPDDFENFNYTYSNEPLLDNTPEKEFWIHRVLRMSDDMSLGWVHGDLAACLLTAWILCYFCAFKGSKSTGKVVYFTATFPYLMLLILFFRGVTLPGAANGLRHLLMPDFRKLEQANVWLDAASQVMFSFSICQGVLTALGSYNKYNNNCYRDCLALCFLNAATSIFAGLVVFSVLGFLAEVMAVPIDDVNAPGIGLVFLIFPQALSKLPGFSFWTIFFFLMVLIISLDNQFVCVESLATAITDMFPRLLRRPRAREILTLVIVIICFLLGLPHITEGGFLLFNIVDNYGGSRITLLIIACLETIIISWIYGVDRFFDNIKDMIGYRPVVVWKYCLLFITPFFCGLMLLCEMARAYPVYVYGYQPGFGAAFLGCLIIMTPLMCIPIFIFVALCRNPNNMTTPSSDLRQARPNKPILTLCSKVVFRRQGKPNRSVDEEHDKMVMEEPSRA